MSDPQLLLLKSNLRSLKLPAMHGEFAKLARGRPAATKPTSSPPAADRAGWRPGRQRGQARIKQTDFPVHKDLDTFDFAAVPGVSKQDSGLARGEWLTSISIVA
jgi:hypothetical protein